MGLISPRSVLRRGYQHTGSDLSYPMLGSPEHGRSSPALGLAHENWPWGRPFTRLSIRLRQYGLIIMLLSTVQVFTPWTCPIRWCAIHWGCLWGIRGCYPSQTPSLVLAPGWWPGGLIPYLKGCWIPLPGRPAARVPRGAFLFNVSSSFSVHKVDNILLQKSKTRTTKSAQGQRGIGPLH